MADPEVDGDGSPHRDGRPGLRRPDKIEAARRRASSTARPADRPGKLDREEASCRASSPGACGSNGVENFPDPDPDGRSSDRPIGSRRPASSRPAKADLRRADRGRRRPRPTPVSRARCRQARARARGRPGRRGGRRRRRRRGRRPRPRSASAAAAPTRRRGRPAAAHRAGHPADDARHRRGDRRPRLRRRRHAGRPDRRVWSPGCRCAGDVIGRGQPIYRVDNTPVVLMYGDVAAYRTLGRATTGAGRTAARSAT